MSAAEELRALDAEFNAPKSTMHVKEYGERRTALHFKMRQEDAESKSASRSSVRPTAPAPTAAPAALPAPPVMDADKRAKLADYRKRFLDAGDRGDIRAMAELDCCEEYENLAEEEALCRAATLMHKVASVDVVSALVSAAFLNAGRMNRRNAIAETRIDLLERRLAAIEERKSVEYRGTWSGAVEYALNDMTTYAGSLWISQKQGTRAKPGDGDAWKLASKKDLPS